MEYYDALSRLKEGDEAAVKEVARALKDGAIVREEIPYILSYAVEAMLAKDPKTGFSAKCSIYNELHQPLIEALAKYSGEMTIGESDIFFQAAQRYELVAGLALASPLSASKADATTAAAAISLGAVLARARDGAETLDGKFEDVARACLMNALKHGGNWTKVHSSEALDAYFGTDTKDIARVALTEILDKGNGRDMAFAAWLLEREFGVDAKGIIEERIWNGSGESRTNAINAYLRLNENDAVALYTLAVMAEGRREIRNEISLIAKSDEATAGAAGAVMSYARNRDELDSAVQDRKFLCEEVIQDPTSPQMAYVECVFDSVEKALGPSPRTETERMGYQVALKQLTTFGVDPGAMKELLDSHTLKVIRRNVENALLHALMSGNFTSLACQGLERIGSDRVEEILDRIVSREGEGTPVGAAASETLASIRGKKLEEVLEFVPPKPPRPPLAPLKQPGARILQ
ncbi:MAG TPA: hypothetical protein VLD37_05975 [Candidatus Bilamarchaeum sp.]|nr:hypothetical protein [Candidatus Bilamarchaeum sp.]